MLHQHQLQKGTSNAPIMRDEFETEGFMLSDDAEETETTDTDVDEDELGEGDDEDDEEFGADFPDEEEE